jgi:hypothetical protein
MKHQKDEYKKKEKNKTIFQINKLEFKLISCLLLFSFVLSISGCTTTETLRVENEDVHYKKDSEILKIIMKDATVIDLRGIPVQYYIEYKDEKDVIVYTTADTTWLTEQYYKENKDKKDVIVYTKTDTNRITERSYSLSTRNYTLSTDTNIIKFGDIKAMTMEYTEFDLIKTILYASGFIVFTALMVLLAFLSSPGLRHK